MHFKIITLTLFLAFTSSYIAADEWPEKECNKLSGYVGLLSAASAGSLEEATEAIKPKPTAVVAPVTRTTSSKKVRLSTSQVNLAKKLGLTPEQYAKEMIRLENKNG